MHQSCRFLQTTTSVACSNFPKHDLPFELVSQMAEIQPRKSPIAHLAGTPRATHIPLPSSHMSVASPASTARFKLDDRTSPRSQRGKFCRVHSGFTERPVNVLADSDNSSWLRREQQDSEPDKTTRTDWVSTADCVAYGLVRCAASPSEDQR